ncbi:MAG: tryptophan synthase subunit alpha [bacterium]
MGRLGDTFNRLASEGKKAYIGYAMAGFPSKGADLEFARSVFAEADILELGVPFSDPIADGIVLQRCAEKALANGGGLARALELAETLRAGSDKPLVLMSYLNPLLARGMESFAHRARVAGVDGVVIPDLPPEEARTVASDLGRAGLDVAFLAAPTSTPKRLDLIAKAATGFIYVVSVAGVTGERVGFDERLGRTVERLRARARVPLAVGFGVSSPESAAEAAALSDGVVVASTVLKTVLDAKDQASGLATAAARCALLARAVRGL